MTMRNANARAQELHSIIQDAQQALSYANSGEERATAMDAKKAAEKELQTILPWVTPSKGPWVGCANSQDRGWDFPNVQDADGNPVAHVPDWQSPQGQRNWMLVTASNDLFHFAEMVYGASFSDGNNRPYTAEETLEALRRMAAEVIVKAGGKVG